LPPTSMSGLIRRPVHTPSHIGPLGAAG
jgi:hypothetical protein